LPQQDPANFQTINYKHDVYGRRSEKEVDGFPLGTPYGAAHGTSMTAPTLSPNTMALIRYPQWMPDCAQYINGPGIEF